MCLTTGLSVNTLRPRQNGGHFADDTFNRIFVNEIVRIAIELSLKFVPKGLINNIPALVQIMAWRRPGDKPLSEPVIVSLLTHKCVTPPQRVNQISDTCYIYIHINMFGYYLNNFWFIINKSPSENSKGVRQNLVVGSFNSNSISVFLYNLHIYFYHSTQSRLEHWTTHPAQQMSGCIQTLTFNWICYSSKQLKIQHLLPGRNKDYLILCRLMMEGMIHYTDPNWPK